MGKNSGKSAKPVLTVVASVPEPKQAKYRTITVRVATGLEFDAAGILQDAAEGGKVRGTVFPYAGRALKSGRFTVTIGKVSGSGRPKLSDAEKAERKAVRENINTTAKNLRKAMRAGNKSLVAFAAKVASGQKLSSEETAELIALVS